MKITAAEHRILKLMAEGRKLESNPAFGERTHLLYTPGNISGFIRVRRSTFNALLDKGLITRAHLTAPVSLTPAGRKAAK